MKPELPITTSDEYGTTRAGAFASVRALLLRHLVVGLLSLGGTTYLVRELGPERWGGFAIAYLLLVSADQILGRALIAGLLRRSVLDDRERRDSTARLILYAGLLLAALLTAFPFAVAPWYAPPGFTVLMLTAAGCTLLYAARTLSATLLERGLRYRPIAGAEIGDVAAFYAVAVSGVAAGHGIGAPSALARRELLPFGLPLVAVLGLSTLDGLVPLAVIGSEEAQVGFLVIAAQLLGYAVAMVTAVGRAGIPSFARLQPQELAGAVRRATDLSTFLTLTALVPAAGLASIWLPALLGERFGDGVPMFRTIALGFFLSAPIAVLTAALTAGGDSGILARAQGLTVALYVGGAFSLVALMGPLGCALAYALSRAANALLIGREAWSRMGVTPGSTTPALLVLAFAALGVITLVADRSAIAGVLVTLALGVAWMIAFRDLLMSSASAMASRIGGTTADQG